MDLSSYRKKVIFIGPTRSGKSTLVNNFRYNKFKTLPTSGIDFHSFMKNNKYFDIWDTSGEEKFKDVIKIYFYQVDSVFLFVDFSKNIVDLQNIIKKWGKFVSKQIRNRNNDNKYIYKFNLVLTYEVEINKILYHDSKRNFINDLYSKIFDNIIYINPKKFHDTKLFFDNYIFDTEKQNKKQNEKQTNNNYQSLEEKNKCFCCSIL